MSAKFKIEDVFVINSKNMPVITGELIEGNINKGDFIILTQIGDDPVEIIMVENFKKTFNEITGINFGLGIKYHTKMSGYLKSYRGQILKIMSKSELRENKLNELGI